MVLFHTRSTLKGTTSSTLLKSIKARRFYQMTYSVNKKHHCTPCTSTCRDFRDVSWLASARKAEFDCVLIDTLQFEESSLYEKEISIGLE